MALYQSGSGLGALVGVGTTNPTSNLQVYGTPIAAGNVFSVLNTAASGNVAQFSSSAGTALIINSIGNVGIGTTNPTSNLQVVGNVLSGNVISSVAMYGVLAGANTVAASTVTATNLIGTHYGAIVGSNTIAASTIYGVIGGANTIACSSVTAQGTAAAGAIYMTGNQLEIGQGQTSDTNAYIDFHTAEGTYSDYAFRIIRNSGANAPVYWVNRGSGSTYFQNQDSGDFVFQSGGVSILGIVASGAIYFGKSNYTAQTGSRPGTNYVLSYDCATPSAPTASATYYGQNVSFSGGNMSGRMWNNSGAPSFYAADTFLQATGCYDGTNNGTGASSQFAGNLYLDGGLSWCLGGSGTTNQCYAGGIYFRTGLSGGGLTTGTPTNRMVIMPNTGYVGIGTNNPIKTLEVYGGIRCAVNGSTTSAEDNNNSIIAYAPGGITGYASIWMGYDPTNDCGYINSARSGQIRPVCLQTRGGSVGIGTTNPSSYTLQVSGTVGASTSFTRTTGSTGAAFNAPGTGIASTDYNYILAGANDTANRLVVFVNGSARSADNGVSNVTIRNDGGSLFLGQGSNPTVVFGSFVGIGTSTNFNAAFKHFVYGGDSSQTLYGPSTTYGTYLNIGAGTTYCAAGRASVNCSNGNLHIDCATGAYQIYLNYFQGGGSGGTNATVGCYAAFFATGDVTAFSSDERLKTKVGLIENALDKVCSLTAFKYIHNDVARANGFTDDKVYVGLSAQEVQKVLPEVVKPAPFDQGTEYDVGLGKSKSGENYLTIQYERIVSLLVESIKEERKAREALTCELRSLEERIKLLEQK